MHVVVLSIASLLSFCVPPAPAAPSTLACRYVEAGVPGPVGNVLEVDGTGNVAIARDGEQIVVSLAKANGWLEEREIECTGGTPTVTTVDQIAYDAPTDLNQILIDERDGRLEPGATDEPAGDDEIEVSIQISRTGDHRPNVHILGTAGPDLIAAADLRGERAGINLNVRDDRSYRDADVIVTRPRRAIVKIDGYGGADRLLAAGAAGGAGFLGPLSLSPLVLLGGEGEDFLLGGFRGDHLEGEAGDDLIVGRGGRDFVYAGSGRDEVFAGSGDDWILGERTSEDDAQFDVYAGGRGDDYISSWRGGRDEVRCGSGFDEARVDRFDAWDGHGCDEVRVAKR